MGAYPFEIKVGAHQITYAPSPKRLIQARFRDRVAMEPGIDLNRYRIEAVVDWVQLRVNMSKPTQFRYVKETVEATGAQGVFVKSLEREESCCRFDVEIQDPTREIIVAVDQALRGRWPLVHIDVSVSGLELAVDFYSRIGDLAERSELLAIVQRHFWVEPEILESANGPMRQIRESADDPEVIETEILQASTNWVWEFGTMTAYAGPKDGSISYRFQHKVTDRRRKGKNGEKIWVDLPPEEHRVRVEVTLLDGGLVGTGYDSFDRLLSGKFESLKGLFRFALPCVPAGWLGADFMAAQNWRKFLAGGVCMQRHMEAESEAFRRKVRRDRERELCGEARRRAPIAKKGPLVSYSKLDEKVRQALRNLSSGWMN